ncbi:uncharacterized protein O3C94_015072 [Discoglossus pictus]
MYLIFTFTRYQCDVVLLSKYKISLYSERQKLCTVLWLRPAYCLYEEWMRETLDLTMADRKTSVIQIKVQPAINNGTYIVPQNFTIPPCDPIFQDYEGTGLFVYKVGPSIRTIDQSHVMGILPGNNYKIRYVLYNDKGAEMACTNWSEPFKTRDMVPSASDLISYLEGRSGGMIVITVLLSIAMFTLLVVLAVAFITKR